MASWSVEETEKLRSEISRQKPGRVDWIRVANHVGEIRTPDQCRAKWRRISGTAKSRAWLVHERSLLKYVVEEQEQLGINWATIKEFFFGRTAAQCRAEWNRMKLSGNDGEPRTQPRRTWDFSEVSHLVSDNDTMSKQINRSASAKRGMLYRLRKDGLG